MNYSLDTIEMSLLLLVIILSLYFFMSKETNTKQEATSAIPWQKRQTQIYHLTPKIFLYIPINVFAISKMQTSLYTLYILKGSWMPKIYYRK